VKLRSGVAPLRSVADTTPRARDELRGKRLYLSNFGPGGVKLKLLLTITNVKEKRSDRKSVPKGKAFLSFYKQSPGLKTLPTV